MSSLLFLYITVHFFHSGDALQRRPSGRRFYLLPIIVFGPHTETANGKDRKYAPVGLPGIFEHPDEEGGITADSGLRFVFGLLHTLAPVAPEP